MASWFGYEVFEMAGQFEIIDIDVENIIDQWCEIWVEVFVGEIMKMESILKIRNDWVFLVEFYFDFLDINGIKFISFSVYDIIECW